MAFGFDSMSPVINSFSPDTQKLSFCWFNFVERLVTDSPWIYNSTDMSFFMFNSPLGTVKTCIQENHFRCSGRLGSYISSILGEMSLKVLLIFYFYKNVRDLLIMMKYITLREN